MGRRRKDPEVYRGNILRLAPALGPASRWRLYRNRTAQLPVSGVQVSVSARVLGIIRHPRQTLQEVASHPTWASLLVGLTLATAAAGALVSATEVGQLALVDQWERTALAFGQPVDDARYAELQAWSRQGPAVAAGNAVLAGPGVAVAVSLLAFGWLRRTRPAAGVVFAGAGRRRPRRASFWRSDGWSRRRSCTPGRPRPAPPRWAPGFRGSTRPRRSPAFLGRSTCSRCGGPSCWGSAWRCCRDGARGPARPGWCRRA